MLNDKTHNKTYLRAKTRKTRSKRPKHRLTESKGLFKSSKDTTRVVKSKGRSAPRQKKLFKARSGRK